MSPFLFDSPRTITMTGMTSMDMEGQLRRLRKTVEEQGSELARLTSELGKQDRIMTLGYHDGLQLQDMVPRKSPRKLFDETLQQTSQQSFTLEHRLSNLEHERETGSRSTRNAFESLGARVTELGVEVAELPTLKEMQATWQQLAQSLESCEKILRAEHQEALSCLSSRLEAALGNLQKETGAGATVVLPPQVTPSEPVTAMASTTSVAAARAPGVTLVKRLKVAEAWRYLRGRQAFLPGRPGQGGAGGAVTSAPTQGKSERLRRFAESGGREIRERPYPRLFGFCGWVGYFFPMSFDRQSVKRTVPPVTLRRTSCGTHAPHTFDLCHLLDDSILPEELNNSVLPRQAFGAFRCEECLTYEFSVRVSDGYRWSDWSPPSARCCFAVEPKIVTTCPVELDELQRALTDVPDVVSPAESVDLSKPLMDMLTFTQEGDMEPPHWVSIARPPSSSDVVTATAHLSEFLVSWPNLPPSAYSQPETEILPAVKQMSETGNLLPFLAPPLVYRINVWMVGLSPDAADVDHQVLQKTLTLEEAAVEDGGSGLGCVDLSVFLALPQSSSAQATSSAAATDFSMLSASERKDYKPLDAPDRINAGGCCSCSCSKFLTICCCLLIFLIVAAYVALVWIGQSEGTTSMLQLTPNVVMYCTPEDAVDMDNLTYNIWWPGCGYDSSVMFDMQKLNEELPSKLVSYPSRTASGIETVQLQGLWLPADSTKFPGPRPRIVVQHGFQSNMNEFRQQFAAFILRSLGFDLLLNNFRDHCGSDQSRERVFHWGDAYPFDTLGAWDYAKDDPDGELGGSMDASKVGVLGFSKGGFTTLNALGLEGKIPGVWVDGAPSEPKTVYGFGLELFLADYGLDFLAPLVVGPAWAIILHNGRAAGVDMEKHLPATTLPLGPDTKRPVYMVQNIPDTTVPKREAERLKQVFEKYPEKYNLNFWMLDKVCKDVDHCANHLSNLAEYKYRLCSFFASLFESSLDCLSPVAKAAKDTGRTGHGHGHGHKEEGETAESEEGKAESVEKAEKLI
eukprot:s1926_g3.t1